MDDRDPQQQPGYIHHVGSLSDLNVGRGYHAAAVMGSQAPTGHSLLNNGTFYSAQATPSPRLFLANGPSFGNLPANVQWAPTADRGFQPVVYHHPFGHQPISIPTTQMMGLKLDQVLGQQFGLSRTDYFDQLFSLAHQKYNSGDFATAHQILLELHRLNASHLPTLLLLGCTCYSLKLYNLSIFYNNLIIGLDPQFSEAYSNLGTTHRAIAQLSALEQPPQGDTIGSSAQVTLYHLDLSERFYRSAIVLRPKYWDATINLAGLLSSQGRWKEALDVYEKLESVFEANMDQSDRRSLLRPSELPFNDDSFLLQTLTELEQKRQKSPFAYLYVHDGFTKERRRDLAYAKGNLHLAIGNVSHAKMEYISGLLAADVDLLALYMRTRTQLSLPHATVTPQEALLTYQQCEQRILNHSTHTIISSLLQTLAKIYQDNNSLNMAVELYYLSIKVYATSNACNNLGIILASQRLDESILWYELGLSMDPKHVHLYTNLGSALKDRGRLIEGIAAYQRAIALKPDFYIALANLANVFKDLGRIDEALALYRRALVVKPDFVEAFCNFVNSAFFICDWSDRDVNLKALKTIVEKQLVDGALSSPPLVPTVLPFHTFTYSNLSAWMVREISRRNADRALWNVLLSDWFPGFPTRPGDIIKKRGHLTEVEKVKCAYYPYPYPIPKFASPVIRIGYLSSDFMNHPLAHLMQSVFGMHDRSRFKTYTYSLSPSDNSPFRQKIENESDVFLDVSAWTTKQIVEQIAQIDEIHILVNLNGYTKGGRNEIFAARPAPIHVSLMGFAGTMGAGSVNDPEHAPDSHVPDDAYFDDFQRRWMDYLVADDVAAPRTFVCGEPISEEEVLDGLPVDVRGRIIQGSDANRIYTEGVIYMPHTYFVNDHRQGFRENEDILLESLFSSKEYQVTSREFDEEDLALDECLRWRKEQVRRLKMRKEVFPSISEKTVIFANFNQLYKMDPDIFACWMNILKAIPNSILWLLRFPAAGEENLKKRAIELVGEDVASRLVFTDVAPKHAHIHRGRIADFFLDTPECNAHTTAADILWSGTPLITFPKYDFKMCSRVAGSVAYATGTWGTWKPPNIDVPMTFALRNGSPKLKDRHLLGHLMVVNSYQEYEERAIQLATTMTWSWKSFTARAKDIKHPSDASSPRLFPTESEPQVIYTPSGPGVRLRQRLFLTRDSMPLFDTQRWVRNLEQGYILAYQKWEKGHRAILERNLREIQGVLEPLAKEMPLESRCISVIDPEQNTIP